MLNTYEHLVGISQATHTREDTEDVDGRREDLHLRAGNLGGIRIDLKLERSVVDAGEVARTGRLVFLGLDGEGVHVDVLFGDASVVLEGLHETEIRTLALIESVVTVELKVRADNNIVDVRLIVIEFITNFGLGDDPDKLLDGVVEVQPVRTVGRGCFIAGELKLFDEEFVLGLRETLALIGVEVDVIDVQGHVNLLVSCFGTRTTVAQIINLSEGEVDLDFVVLQSNEGESKTMVAVEEELKGDVESRPSALNVSTRGTTDHIRVKHTFLGFGGAEFGPDVEPFAVVTIDTLAADFEFDLFDEVMTDVGVPLPTITECREFYFENGVCDEIAVAAHGDSRLATETGSTIEYLSDGFNGKVCVTAVNRLEECNFGVTGEVNVLSAVGYELH